MSDESEEGNIRLDVVDKFYDKLDAMIDEAYEKDKISYGEIDIAFVKMNDKILQQKITLMYHYLKDEHGEEEGEPKSEPDGLYK
jgi:predicted transport protein